MKLTIAALLFAFVAVAHANTYLREVELRPHFELFKAKFNKQYSDVAEEARRFRIFARNVEYIVKHNVEADLGLHDFTLGINQFADMHNEEFRGMVNGLRLPEGYQRRGENFTLQGPADLPTAVDWRNQGLVTPIKDQGQCGSCWAFSTVASLEGQHAKATGKLVSLSEQDLVDCSHKEGNQGCEGGLMDDGFQYVKDVGGIDTESCYPYKAVDESCRHQKTCVGATLKSWVDVPSKNEQALQKAVATVGPISVAIDAGSILFQFYRKGVYTDPFCSQTNLDHGVTAVGYGTENGKDYWLVKNSWGTVWGEQGYIKMRRNHNNMCGIATQASYPVV